MKARIEKKLSKKAVQIAPKLFSDAWVCQGEEPSDLAYDQGTCVSNVYYVGGGLDYWGEGQDAYTVWQCVMDNWPWIGDFPINEDTFSIDTGNFKPTTKNLLRLLGKINEKSLKGN